MRHGLLLLALLSFSDPLSAAWQPDQNDTMQVQAFAMLEQITEAENAQFRTMLDESYAFAIFPNVSRSGLLLGWASGKGVLIVNGHFAGYVRQRRISLGFQFGHQSQGQVLLFLDEETVEAFKQGRIEFTPQASAHASRPRKAAETSYTPRVASFSLTQSGLMLEAAVGASKFKYTPANAR